MVQTNSISSSNDKNNSKKASTATTSTITTMAEDKGNKSQQGGVIFQYVQCMNSTRMMVLTVLCLQNSLFTVVRRYSQGVLREVYSKHELLLVAELIKIVFSAWMISKSLPENVTLTKRISYLIQTSKKMAVLALIYGAMNILSFVSLRNISAGMFTIFAQCKILTTATFSSIVLQRQYSWTKWRSLIALMLGVLLFSEPIWGNPSKRIVEDGANTLLGTTAVLIEVTLSGFASIYFEKVIKTDPLQLNIWERNFQLALSSFPVYIVFIGYERGGEAGLFGGWSWIAMSLALLGAAGGLLVALSIKHGDSILKTLATTGSIILSATLDHLLLGGPLTPSMMIAAGQVIIAICNYSFDATPPPAVGTPATTTTTTKTTTTNSTNNTTTSSEEMIKSPPSMSSSTRSYNSNASNVGDDDDEESNPLLTKRQQHHSKG